MYEPKPPPQVIPVLLAGAALLLSLLLLCWKAGAMDPAGTQLPSAPSVHSSQDAANMTSASDDSRPAPSITEVPSAIPASVPAGESAPTNAVAAPDPAAELNSTRLLALGMIESGNKDSAVGGQGEVSRFQIMPAVWKQYSASVRYQDPGIASEVASQHWSWLHDYFKRHTDREPTDFDMYVLWNTRFGYYASREFSPGRLHPVVRDRAQRFSNLVEDGYRRASVLALAASR